MLETIKEKLNEPPLVSFEEFYQSYVEETQDRILRHQIAVDSHKFRSIDDINTIVRDLNSLTEELKK